MTVGIDSGCYTSTESAAVTVIFELYRMNVRKKVSDSLMVVELPWTWLK